jgi:hypothetical protein
MTKKLVKQRAGAATKGGAKKKGAGLLAIFRRAMC